MSDLARIYDSADVCSIGTWCGHEAALVAQQRHDGQIQVFADDENADGLSNVILTRANAARFARRLLAVAEHG